MQMLLSSSILSYSNLNKLLSGIAFHRRLTPPRSDDRQALEIMKKVGPGGGRAQKGGAWGVNTCRREVAVAYGNFHAGGGE